MDCVASKQRGTLLRTLLVVLVVCLACYGVEASGGCENSVFLQPPYDGLSVQASTAGTDPFPSPCYNSGAGSRFYTIMPSYGGELTVSTCEGTTFNSAILLLDGPDCDHLNCLMDSTEGDSDCTWSGSSINFIARQQYYYIMITGVTEGDHGDFTLTLTTGLPDFPLACPGFTTITEPLSPPVRVYGSVTLAGGFHDVVPMDEFETSSLIFRQITTTDFPMYFNEVNADSQVPGGSRVLSVEVYYTQPYSAVISSVGYGDWSVTTPANSAVMTRLLYFGDLALDGSGVFNQTGLNGYDGTHDGMVNAFRIDGAISLDATLIVTAIDMDGNIGSGSISIIGVRNARSYVISYDDLQPQSGDRVDFTNLGSMIVALVCGGTGMEGTWDYFSFAQWTQPTAISYNVCETSNNHFTMDWYRLDLTSNNPVTVSTCNSETNFPSDVAVMSGGCPHFDCVGTQQLPCNENPDNGKQLQFYPVLLMDADSTAYYIAVSAQDTTPGDYMLEISQEAGGSSEEGSTCGNSIHLQLGSMHLSTVGGEVYRNLCGLATQSPSVWLQYSPDEVGTLVVSTCDQDTVFDTVMVAVDNCNTLECIVSNDDTPCDEQVGASAISVNVSHDSTYYIAVSGYAEEEGSFALLSTFTAS
mmetsp:Transcript_2046/g.7413  ORF Transcript_2046/g.7413 Transcript_2046/m.7413 type:complete len:641 (+) Transcript_2046:29-1951(+)